MSINEQAAPSSVRDRALHFSWAAFIGATAAATIWRLFKEWESFADKTKHRIAAGVTSAYVCNYAWLVYCINTLENVEWTEFPQNRGGEQAL